MKKHIIILCAVFVLELALGLLIYGKTSTLVFENDIYNFVSSDGLKAILKSGDKTISAKYEDFFRANDVFPVFCGNFDVFLPNGKKVSLRKDYDVYDPDTESTKGGKYVNIIHSDGTIIMYPVNYLDSKAYMMTAKEYKDFLLLYSDITFDNDRVSEKQKEELMLMNNITEKKDSIIELKDFNKYIIATIICFLLAMTSIILSNILNSRDKSGSWLIKWGYVFSVAPLILLIMII